MNPSNIKNRTDQMKIREAYLANLQAQQTNLDKTAYSLKITASTGQSPIAPQDTRSMSEKFSDIEKLKLSLRTMLASLTDSPQANIIMSALSDEEIQGVVLLFPDIERNLKPRFSSGVPAPIFIEYIRRYLKDYSKNLGLSTGLQDVVASELQLTRSMLSKIIPNQAIMMDLIHAISSAPASVQQQQALVAAQTLSSALPSSAAISNASSSLSPVQVQNLNDLTTAALQNVPTASQIQGLTKDITDALRSGNIKDATNILGETLQFIKLQQADLQNLKDISDVVQQKEQQSAAKQEQGVYQPPPNEVAKVARLVNSKQTSIKEQTGTKMNTQGVEVPIFASAKTDLQETGKITDANMKLAVKIIEIDRASPDELQTLKLTKAAVIGYYDYLSKRDQNKSLSFSDRKSLTALKVEDMRQLLITDKDQTMISMPTAQSAVASSASSNISGLSISAIVNDDIAAGRIQTLDNFEQFDFNEQMEYLYQITDKGMFDNNLPVKTMITDVLNTKDAGGVVTPQEVIDLYTQVKTISGMGFKSFKKYRKKVVFGCGLGVKNEPKLFPSKADINEGFPIDKSYIPFGRYVINRHKLSDGKLMVKTISGGAIPKIPTLCISNDLGRIIKKMVGGAMPTYNEMNLLNEEEQNTLYKVFKLAQIEKADLLPSPNKSKEESEMNKFMILKGEIQSGNDSKELIKEFKLMLMKLINGGKIPKNQGMDIMCDLMALGY